MYFYILVRVSHMTFSVPEDLKRRAQQRRDVNWSGFVATAIARRLEAMQEVDRREQGDSARGRGPGSDPWALAKQIRAVGRDHGIKAIQVFGSVARGDAGPASDLDLLVELAQDRSYFDLFAFERAVAKLVGRRVEATTASGLHPRIRDRVLAEARAL